MEIESNVLKEKYVALAMHTCSEKMKMYAALFMHRCAKKRTFLDKDNLTTVEWGEEMHLKECTRLELTQP